MTSHAFRAVTPISLVDLLNGSNSQVYCSPFDVLNRLFEANKRELMRITNEYEELRSMLEQRYRKTALLCPKTHALGESSSFLTYLMVRIRRPIVVFETGVANGQATFFILNALSKNKRGSLYSTDISTSVGRLLTNEERANWRLEVIDTHRIHASFREVVNKMPEIDLFLHDSDHSYSWSKFEYETVGPRMNHNSIIATDDVQWSYSFLDFAKNIGISPVILLDRRRAFGVLLLK